MTQYTFDDNATIQQTQTDILTWAEENQLREEVLEYNANQTATTLDHQLDATRAAAQLPGIIAQLVTMSQQTNISYSELNKQMSAFMDGLDSTTRMLAFPLATLFFPRPPYVGCGSVEPMPIVVTEPIQPETVQPVPIVSSSEVQSIDSTPIVPIVDNVAQAVG
ncbi:hypothetical protein WR25_01695 [Diploscapter pachys]|uniref:SXP/RAL-2 family protein Ani s 5-like cation-binding domain-containing protein n=1 Tax=Diploscapter pachys TaxID=2018661 RepID=A0A2A2JSS9_9BILA|nr:hypothetical protein WR25_01695 [Diploscapter pachys]